MSTLRIDVQQILQDIRHNMDKKSIMPKYGLSAPQFDDVINDLLQKGLLSKDDLSMFELLWAQATGELWYCPHCKKPQARQMDVCPQCWATLPKFQNEQRASESADSSRPQEEETSNDPRLSQDRTGPSSSLFDDKRLYGLIAAFALVSLMLWVFLPSKIKGPNQNYSKQQEEARRTELQNEQEAKSKTEEDEGEWVTVVYPNGTGVTMHKSAYQLWQRTQEESREQERQRERENFWRQKQQEAAEQQKRAWHSEMQQRCKASCYDMCLPLWVPGPVIVDHYNNCLFGCERRCEQQWAP